MTGLQKKFDFLNGCLYIKELKLCAASDLHIGLEDELRRQGLAFPLQEEQMLLEKLNAVLKIFQPQTFILAGDVLHSFSRMDKRVRDKFERIMELLERKCRVILLRGSHDTLMGTLDREVLERHDFEGFTFAHGHADLQEHRHLVVGHEHPVIQIEMERLPCFLYGKSVAGGQDLVLLPAFNPLCQGGTINQVEGRDFMSPLLKRIDSGELYPVVEVKGEVLAFPKLKELRGEID